MTFHDRAAGITKLVGGRLFLDFVNLVGGRNEETIRDDKLNDYVDLLAWSVRTGILSRSDAEKLFRASELKKSEAASVFNRAVRLRESLFHICKSILHKKTLPPTDLNRLNDELVLARTHARLKNGKENLTWEWKHVTSLLDGLLWPIADSAAEFLTSGDLTRLRECAGDDCGWLFEDTSKNRSRQWCDMRDCGNLAKVRRFRERAKG
jgi:predicted RNA-binding Zn ribbon-like protein